MSDAKLPTIEVEDVVRKYKRRTRVFVGWLVAAQAVLFVVAGILTPQFLTIPRVFPFAVMCLCVWEVIGLLILYNLPLRSPGAFVLGLAVFLLVFTLPLLGFLFVGPPTQGNILLELGRIRLPASQLMS